MPVLKPKPELGRVVDERVQDAFNETLTQVDEAMTCPSRAEVMLSISEGQVQTDLSYQCPEPRIVAVERRESLACKVT